MIFLVLQYDRERSIRERERRNRGGREDMAGDHSRSGTTGMPSQVVETMVDSSIWSFPRSWHPGAKTKICLRDGHLSSQQQLLSHLFTCFWMYAIQHDRADGTGLS